MNGIRHLSGIMALTDADFEAIIARSLVIREMMDRGAGPAPALSGRLLANLFFEDSTRTLMSFEIAATRLGALTVTLPKDASSLSKGETMDDTVLTLGAQGADYIIIRAKAPGTIGRAIEVLETEGFPSSVINAGEGALGHPSQGLLDVATALWHLGRRMRDGLDGVVLTICGDVAHSRVAASAIEAFARLGARVRLAGPKALLPKETPQGVEGVFEDLDEALAGADVAMALRIQKERMETDPEIGIPDYHARYALTHDRMARAKPGAIVMHPGPMNRDVEIAAELADDPDRSVIRSQVRQGVATRMALLEQIERGKSR